MSQYQPLPSGSATGFATGPTTPLDLLSTRPHKRLRYSQSGIMAQLNEDPAYFLDLNLDEINFNALDQPQDLNPNNTAQNPFDFNMPLHNTYGLPQTSQQIMSTIIPPTPNSVEMHPDPNQYLRQLEAQERAIMSQHYQMRKPDQHYTPNTSPIVPVNNLYTVPGAYFSPLTSPALEGQQYSYQNTTTSASSVTTSSPIDMDMDMLEGPNSKSRKRPNPTRTSTTIPRSTHVSPAMNPRRTRNRSNFSRSTNEFDSISPEPLSESMPPPLHPASASNSPALRGTSQSRPGPATPASLMRIRNSPNRTSQPQTNLAAAMLPPLSLPEAAANVSMPIDPRLDGGSDLEVLAPRKTPKLGSLSTPSGSVTPSVSKPTSPITSHFASSRKESKSGRGMAKKRSSISSNTLISPAIRPKISPNIKPLLPDGATHTDDAHAIFLASRSNYQNLIEGTHVPGVSYPSELSTNLTSKRTSHKIAEQGRRDRINHALTIMSGLLPKDPNGNVIHAKRVSPGGSDDGEGQAKSGGKGNGNSKAATVESAIEYIKDLQVEKVEWDENKKELEKLQKEIKRLTKLVNENGLN